MRRPAFCLACVLFSAAPAAASDPAEVKIVDLETHRELPIYRHRGRSYVAGEPGHEYEIRVRNRASGRLLAVTSVDGVNVISGETASPEQTGYVLEAHDDVRIQGWRKNLDRVARFYFTALPDSYAARTGRPDDVGVIGVALFRERERPRELSRDRIEEPRTAAPSAQSGSAARSEDSASESERLGTGHGRSADSAAAYTSFERASKRPVQTLTIWYDSYRNLAAQGMIAQDREYADRRPRPFPGGFVPDP